MHCVSFRFHRQEYFYQVNIIIEFSFNRIISISKLNTSKKCEISLEIINSLEYNSKYGRQVNFPRKNSEETPEFVIYQDSEMKIEPNICFHILFRENNLAMEKCRRATLEWKNLFQL